MTGPREAGVLLGQARSRTAHREGLAPEANVSLSRIAGALEGIEVSLAVIADLLEAHCEALDDEAIDEDDDDICE